MLNKIIESVVDKSWKSGKPSFKTTKKINLDDAFNALRSYGYTISHAESTPQGAFYWVTDSSGKKMKKSGSEIKYFLTH